MNDVVIPGMGVVDVFRAHHGPNEKQYSWFARSVPQGQDCARVDYALVDANWAATHVTSTKYLEDPVDRAHSDHAPVLLDLDLDLF